MDSYKIKASAIVLVFFTSGCAPQLKLHYADYGQIINADPKAEATNKAIMEAALDGAQTFPLPRTNIFVVPTATLTSDNKAGATPSAQSAPEAAALPASPAKKSSTTKQQQVAKEQQPVSDTTDTQKTSTSSSSVSTKLANPLATAVINGVSWSAIAVPAEDNSAYFSVTGTNNLFHSDTLSIGHPDNSDIVSSINSKAVNNTATLIGTAAGVVAAILPIVGAAAPAAIPENEADAKKAQFQPTWIRVPDNPVETPAPIPNVPYWYYSLNWDLPAGTVSFQRFLSSVKGKDVSVFPVPACITATLSLYHNTTPNRVPDPIEKPDATFIVKVETPHYIRPYQIPGVGSVTMGSICGASSTDSSPSESETAQDILKALSSAATTINSAINKKANSSDNATPAATGSTGVAASKSN